jgi:hypothetical protein
VPTSLVATAAATAAVAVNQCNGTDNAGSQAVACTVTSPTTSIWPLWLLRSPATCKHAGQHQR